MATGKRAGARRAAQRPPGNIKAVLIHAAGITAAVVAWGYLVFAAIDFGTAARAGASIAWAFLALAAAGAAACLFAGIMMGMRLSDALRPPPGADGEPAAPRPVGGRRAAR